MQKRKPGQPHKGWKAAARKSRRRKPNKIVQGLCDAIQAKVRAGRPSAIDSQIEQFLRGNPGVTGVTVPRKGHSPWNDPDSDNRASDDGMPLHEVEQPTDPTKKETWFRVEGHDAGIPSDANEVLHGAKVDDFERRWDDIVRRVPATEDIAGVLGRIGIDQKPTDRSTIVAEMQAQRSAPKGPFAPSPYTKESEDASKMRDRLTDCFTILAKAIEKVATAIVAGRDLPESPLEMPSVEPQNAWNPVGQGTPLNTWLETTRLIVGGYHIDNNVCMCRILSIGDEPEWCEKHGGRTTVTHSTFAPPTHWRWPVPS